MPLQCDTRLRARPAGPGGTRKRTAFPPPARDARTRAVATRETRGQRRPRRVRKRPPLAGRALAGGFGPRLGWVSPLRCGKGDGLCHWGGVGRQSLTIRRNAKPASARAPPGRAGSGNAPRFPRPCGTPHAGPSQPAKREASAGPGGCESARHWRGVRWPGALAPGPLGVTVALWQRRWPLPWGRGGLPRV